MIAEITNLLQPAATGLKAVFAGRLSLLVVLGIFSGADLSARFYWSLDDDHKLVIASQSILDAIVGNLPYDAMSRIGGSQALNDYNAFGGSLIGRGLREQLYVGRFKAIEQLEFRYNFWSFTLWRQNFEMVAAAFTDIGLVAWDYKRFLKDMRAVQVGFGPGYASIGIRLLLSAQILG